MSECDSPANWMHSPYLEERLKVGVWNGQVLLHELRDRGYRGGYTILTDWLRPQRQAAYATAVRRFETPPAKQAQVDWGHLGYLEVDGAPQKIWGFTITLGYSRRTWSQAALEQTLGTLLRMHEAAFQEWGGVPEEIRYDFVPGNKIVLLLPAALCGLGRARAVECGARHDLWHIRGWLRSMMIFGSGLPNGDYHYARTRFRQACNDRPHPGKLACSRD